MEINIGTFQKKMLLMQKLVVKKSATPILLCVQLMDGQLVGTDLDHYLSVPVPEGKNDCFLIPYKQVMESLKYLSPTGTLKIFQVNKNIRMEWEGGAATFPTQNTTEFPGFPAVSMEKFHRLNGDLFVKALETARPFCAEDDTKPVLAGITVYLDSVISFAAADGFQMSYESVSKLSYPVEQDIIVKRETVDILSDIWKKGRATPDSDQGFIQSVVGVSFVNLAINGDWACLKWKDVNFMFKLTAGTHADHVSLLNSFDNPVKVAVFANTLSAVVSRLKPIAKEAKGVVRITWDTQKMKIAVVTSTEGTSEEIIPVYKSETPGRFGMNVDFLLKYLKGKDGLLRIGKTEKDNSAVIFSYGNAPLYVAMPMEVDWDGKGTTQAADNSSPTDPDDTIVEVPSGRAHGVLLVDKISIRDLKKAMDPILESITEWEAAHDEELDNPPEDIVKLKDDYFSLGDLLEKAMADLPAPENETKEAEDDTEDPENDTESGDNETEEPETGTADVPDEAGEKKEELVLSSDQPAPGRKGRKKKA